MIASIILAILASALLACGGQPASEPSPLVYTCETIPTMSYDSVTTGTQSNGSYSVAESWYAGQDSRHLYTHRHSKDEIWLREEQIIKDGIFYFRLSHHSDPLQWQEWVQGGNGRSAFPAPCFSQGQIDAGEVVYGADGQPSEVLIVDYTPQTLNEGVALQQWWVEFNGKPRRGLLTYNNAPSPLDGGPIFVVTETEFSGWGEPNEISAPRVGER